MAVFLRFECKIFYFLVWAYAARISSGVSLHFLGDLARGVPPLDLSELCDRLRHLTKAGFSKRHLVEPVDKIGTAKTKYTLH